MSDNATFEPIQRDSTARMFGPRAVLLVGFAAGEQERILQIVSRFEALACTVARPGDEQQTVESLLKRSDRTGWGEISSLPRLLLMSGLTQQELHEFMAEFRKTGLVRPMWAALTPTSATWRLSELLDELDAERRAMEKQQTAPSQSNEDQGR